ncbi:MAG: hypothetical protein JNL63_04915 [Bacteroidia bacterium]|nr:hypothetical protein [Bacteroidia bacterium]
MKTPSDDLFRLVKSLDTQEKVYFKAFGAKKNQGKDSLGYMKLFDVVDKLKVNDEAILRANLAKKGFNYNLKNAKEQLTEAIYKSLAEFHSGQSITRQLQNLIYYAELLYGKRLNKPAGNLVKKVEKLALQYEQYNYLLITNSIKLSAIRQTQNIGEIEQYVKKEIDKERHYFDCLKNISNYNNIALRLEKLEHTYATGSATKNNELIRIINLDLLKSPDKALTFSSLHQYYFIHFLLYKLTGSGNKEAYIKQKEWLKYLESKKDELKFRAGNYIGVLARLVTIMVHLRLDKELEATFSKAKRFLEGLSSKTQTKSLKSAFMSLTINYIGGQNSFNKPAQSIQSWENIKHIVTFETLSDSIKMVLCGNLFHSYFLVQNFHEALNYLNKIINSKTQNRLDILNHARFYLLMTHYELENVEFLPYMTRATRRSLLKAQTLVSEYDKCILNYFERVLPKIRNKQEEKETFKKWRQELDNIPGKSVLYSEIENFDFILWIESKIQQRNFADILKETGMKKKYYKLGSRHLRLRRRIIGFV